VIARGGLDAPPEEPRDRSIRHPALRVGERRRVQIKLRKQRLGAIPNSASTDGAAMIGPMRTSPGATAGRGSGRASSFRGADVCRFDTPPPGWPGLSILWPPASSRRRPRTAESDGEFDQRDRLVSGVVADRRLSQTET